MLAKEVKERELNRLAYVYKVALQLGYKDFQVCNKPLLLQVFDLDQSPSYKS